MGMIAEVVFCNHIHMRGTFYQTGHCACVKRNEVR